MLLLLMYELKFREGRWSFKTSLPFFNHWKQVKLALT